MPDPISRRSFLPWLATGTLRAALPKRPNIVFLLLDDLGWSDFGCYGNKFHETPNLDRLASEGVRFTNAYAACPVCSPTRASILTGKYPARLHLTNWIPGQKQPQAKLLQPPFEQQLPLEEITVAEHLKQIGYRTASIGKWHLGGAGFGPENQGFDVNVAGTSVGHTPSYFGPFDVPRLKGGTKDDYITEKLTEAAEHFIEDSAKQGPFFLYLPEFAVHTPLQAREAGTEKYRRKNSGKDFPNPTYAAMVESVDTALGQIRKKLDKLGLSENTILIVTSDNGGVRWQPGLKQPITDNSPLRAGKGHLYEGGIREPLLVHWPGVTRAGTVLDSPVSSVDHLPTIVEMAGGAAPKGIDGFSFTGVLRGKHLSRPKPLYWHYPHYSPQGGTPSSAIRNGDWKLIEFFEDGRLELFNLKSDIGERQNLVEREPKKTLELHGLLKRWRSQVNAALPRVNPGYDPAKATRGMAGLEAPTPPVR